jgi:hypothetical protein
MKILTSIVVAGALAATSIAATATGASADGWDHQGWDHHRPYHHNSQVIYRSSPDAGGALFAGALLGLAFGAIASNSFAEPQPQPLELPPPHPNYAAADDHYAWCARTYRSYNGETDTFFDFQGIERRCVTPYE